MIKKHLPFFQRIAAQSLQLLFLKIFVTPGFGKELNASHMSVRIKFHTYDRRYKCISEVIS
jgi:hypothetical protein